MTALCLVYLNSRSPEYTARAQFLIESDLGQRIKTYLDSPEGFLYFSDRIQKYSGSHFAYPLEYNRLIVVSKNKKLGLIYKSQTHEEAENFIKGLPAALSNIGAIQVSFENVGQVIDVMYVFKDYLMSSTDSKRFTSTLGGIKKKMNACTYSNVSLESSPAWTSFVKQVDGTVTYLQNIIQINSLSPKNLETSIQEAEQHKAEYLMIIFVFSYVAVYLSLYWVTKPQS